MSQAVECGDVCRNHARRRHARPREQLYGPLDCAIRCGVSSRVAWRWQSRSRFRSAFLPSPHTSGGSRSEPTPTRCSCTAPTTPTPTWAGRHPRTTPFSSVAGGMPAAAVRHRANGTAGYAPSRVAAPLSQSRARGRPVPALGLRRRSTPPGPGPSNARATAHAYTQVPTACRLQIGAEPASSGLDARRVTDPALGRTLPP
jgi:hypothetical protein